MSGIYGLGAKLVATALTTHYSTAAGAYLSTSYTLVEITNIGETNMTAADIDVSSHAGRVRSFLKGLIDMGEVPFTGNYQVAVGPKVTEYLTNSASTQEQRVIVPGHFLMTFPGYVKGFGFGIPHDDKISMSGVIKISGSPTIYTSTSTS